MTIAERLAEAGIEVKPLEWVDTEDDRGDGTSEHNGGYAADSPLGVYEIGMGFGSDCYYWSVSDSMLNEIGSFEDPIYAKAAAQADYTARILAALSASPEVQALIAAAETRGWNAAIEAAAKLLGKYVDGLIEEYGNHEWDTNVTNLPEWVVTIEEEFETQSAAIRALKKGE